MMDQKGKKRVKTDMRDAKNIAKCLACHTYSPVHIPTEEDEQVKDYIRIRSRWLAIKSSSSWLASRNAAEETNRTSPITSL